MNYLNPILMTSMNSSQIKTNMAGGGDRGQVKPEFTQNKFKIIYPSQNFAKHNGSIIVARPVEEFKTNNLRTNSYNGQNRDQSMGTNGMGQVQYLNVSYNSGINSSLHRNGSN